jgi:hypothetical protein
MPLVSTILCPSYVTAPYRQSKCHYLHEKPSPTPSFLSFPVPSLGILVSLSSCLIQLGFRGIRAGWYVVEIFSVNAYDIKVIRKFPSFSGKSEVRNGWDANTGSFEAKGPFIKGFILKLKF